MKRRSPVIIMALVWIIGMIAAVPLSARLQPKRAGVEKELKEAIPLGSSPGAVIKYLDRKGLGHSEYLDDVPVDGILTPQIISVMEEVNWSVGHGVPAPVDLHITFSFDKKKQLRKILVEERALYL